jgi:hypothetical protein
MVDPTPSPHPETGTGGNTDVGPGRGSPPGMPRWVRISLVIVVALILLAVIVHLAGGGPGLHSPGPSRHGG